jgi:fucose permease
VARSSGSKTGQSTVIVEVGVMIAVLGLPDGALGVAWPSLRHTFGLPVGDLGLIALVGIIPYLLASTGVTRLVRRVGFGTTSIAFAVLATAAMAAWASAPAWGVVLAAAAAYGASRGAVDSSFNAYVSEHEGVRRLGLLHAGYGIGATLAPLIVATVLSLGAGWRVALGVLAAADLAATAGAWAMRSAWRPSRHADLPHDADAAASHRARVAMLLATFVVYTGSEAGIGAWAFTVGTDGRHLDRGLVAGAVAVYWAMLTGGRLLLAGIGGRVGREVILIGGSALALAGVVLFWLNHSDAGLIGLIPAGFGFAATFPVVISMVPDYVGDRRSAHIIGWCVAFAAIGGPAGTALGGFVAGHESVNTVPPVYAVLAAALIVCVIGLTRLAPARD